MANYKVKITCYTPKGKAEKSSISFGMKYFSALKKPIETKVVNDSEFYYIYEYKKQKDVDKLIKVKLPKAEFAIRNFYVTIIHLVKRGNKLAKKGAWKVEKTRRWIMKMLKKKVRNPKEAEDFANAIDISDEKELMEFLSKDLFKAEITEVNEDV